MEGLLKEYPNTLILRVRMPIVADLTYPRNFITKIIKYEKVGGGAFKSHHMSPRSCTAACAWAICLIVIVGQVCIADIMQCPHLLRADAAEFLLADHQHPELHDSAARAAAVLH